jgi:hypothetical protein
LASALILVGVLVMGIAGGSAFSAISKGGRPISFPPGATLDLKEGIYVGVKDPREKTGVQGIFVNVLDQATGQAIPVTMSGLGTAEETAKNPVLFQFQVLYEGSYMLTGASAEMGGTAKVLLLHESVARARSDLAVGLIAGCLLIGGGIFVIIATWRKAKKPAKPA